MNFLSLITRYLILIRKYSRFNINSQRNCFDNKNLVKETICKLINCNFQRVN